MALVGFAGKLALECTGLARAPIVAGCGGVETVAAAHVAGALAGPFAFAGSGIAEGTSLACGGRDIVAGRASEPLEQALQAGGQQPVRADVQQARPSGACGGRQRPALVERAALRSAQLAARGLRHDAALDQSHVV